MPEAKGRDTRFGRVRGRSYVGLGRAKELVMLGRPIGNGRCLLGTRHVDDRPGGAVDAAVALAQEMAALAPLALAWPAGSTPAPTSTTKPTATPSAWSERLEDRQRPRRGHRGVLRRRHPNAGRDADTPRNRCRGVLNRPTQTAPALSTSGISIDQH